jgi:hypothetical protein
VAPIELIGFPRRKAQRHIGLRCCCTLLPRPGLGVAPHSIVAAFIAKTAKLFKNTDKRQPFS